MLFRDPAGANTLYIISGSSDLSRFLLSLPGLPGQWLIVKETFCGGNYSSGYCHGFSPCSYGNSSPTLISDCKFKKKFPIPGISLPEPAALSFKTFGRLIIILI